MGVSTYNQQIFWGLKKPQGYVMLGRKGQDRADCICLLERDSVPEGVEIGKQVILVGSRERTAPTSGIRIIEGCSFK